MAHEGAMSFEQVAFNEAAARRVRVSLMLRPVHAGDPGQLSSRFLGTASAWQIVLATPTGPGGRKVFLPDGWSVGMGFAVGNLFIQAHSTVEGHCQYSVHSTRRVDGLVVRRPERVTSVIRRRETRHEPPAGEFVTATVWPERGLLADEEPPRREGRLVNWSDSGLGIRLPSPLPLSPGEPVVVRIDGLGADPRRFCTGIFKHCTPIHEGGHLAGVGEVTELDPGQAVGIVEALARQE